MDKAVPSTTTTASPEQQPRRNLSEAFEALCTGSTIVEAPPTTTSKEDASDGLKLSSSSPTSVVEAIHAQVGEEPLKLPTIALVQDLQRDLSTECVARISIYSMIHDINKEATTLAALDPIAPPDASCKGPLLLALRGESTCPLQPSSSSQSSGTTKRKIQSSDQAIIDEEKWLLTEILSQTEAYTEEIPATFHQALGDREYQNPHRAGRTQLWKPGRSWWEAKSGKNPWIEPSLHNQRWRYLWPLIHYHKFLAKCIKKLKRNGLDVTLSPHSISIFLRQEVCAVSDHLASVSLFGSETWMQSLPQFNGWVDDRPEARMLYRRYVSHLPLRGMNDPADVDSPVLRDQVDEAFLRALTQHADRDSTVPSRRSKEDATVATESTTQQQQQGCIEDPENVPRNIRGRRYYGWYDANSVHSELSTNSYSAYDYNNCLYMHPNYYSEHNNYAPAYPWMNYYHPVYTATNYEEAVPATPTPHHSHEMPSPYWGHLEQVAAMGLATPSTPARHRSPRKSTKK